MAGLDERRSDVGKRSLVREAEEMALVARCLYVLSLDESRRINLCEEEKERVICDDRWRNVDVGEADQQS